MCIPLRQPFAHKSKQHGEKKWKKYQALIKSDWVHLEICLYSRVVKRTDQRGQRCSCLFIAVLIFSQVWHLFAPIHPSLSRSLALFYHHILSFLPHGEVKHCDSAVFRSCTQVWAVTESLHMQTRVVTSLESNLQSKLMHFQTIVRKWWKMLVLQQRGSTFEPQRSLEKEIDVGLQRQRKRNFLSSFPVLKFKS